MATGRAAIAFAKKIVKDLDAPLSAAQRSEHLAFSTLIQHKLDPATELSLWCEEGGFSEYRKVRGSEAHVAWGAADTHAGLAVYWEWACFVLSSSGSSGPYGQVVLLS